MSYNRRQFLKRTAIAASSIGAIGTASSPATANHSPPYISTRDHYDDDANLASGQTTTSYDTNGAVPGVDVGCVEDLTVFVHGWAKKDDGDAFENSIDKIEHAGHGLSNNGYDGTVIGYSWDNENGGGWDYGWGTAKDIAQQNGRKLAQFAIDFKTACPDATLRIQCHSLGAQVTFSCLRELDAHYTWNANGWEIETVHLMGAAQDNEAPTDEWPDTYWAIYNQTRATFNYHSEEDDTLEWIYRTIEFDNALGRTGAESGHETPPNYTDFDATSQVGDDHSGYIDNCSDEIVYHIDNVGFFD